MKRLAICSVWMLAWGAASVGFGANLGMWALTTNGVGTSEEAAKVIVGNFVGGSGIGAITYGTSGGYASGWTANATPDATDYFEVTIAPTTGFSLVVTEIDYSERRSSTGVREFQVRASTNNFSSYTLLATEPVPDNDSERSHSISGLNLSVAEGQTFRLRFYGYLAEGSGGNWRINDGSLQIVGTAMSMTGPPTVVFVPGSDARVHVSNTLDVAVSVLPAGGIQQWAVVPTPAGTTNFSAGTFHFTPAAADEGVSYALTMLATNSYGSATGTLGITVTEYLSPGTYEITFDNVGEVKTGWGVGAVTLNGREWIMDEAIIADSDADLKHGARSARFGNYYQATMVSSNTLLPAGLGTVSFWYAQYGGGDNGVELVVEVATNATTGDWMEVGRVDADGVTNLTKYATNVDLNQPMYLRFRTDYAEGVGSANVDSILIAPYQAPTYTAYEQYLRSYNVTPGDSGTAPGEDWDGDGVSNTNEFNALTNPYDAASHP